MLYVCMYRSGFSSTYSSERIQRIVIICIDTTNLGEPIYIIIKVNEYK